MVQYYKEFQICKTRLLPLGLSTIKDPFARELLDLWRLRKLEGSVYIAYLYTLPVGFILLQNNSENRKTIRGTWIDAKFRGQGLGEALMKAVQKEYEHEPVDILVNITKGAEGFYEKYGFKIVGYREDFDMNIGLWESLTSNE